MTNKNVFWRTNLSCEPKPAETCKEQPARNTKEGQGTISLNPMQCPISVMSCKEETLLPEKKRKTNLASRGHRIVTGKGLLLWKHQVPFWPNRPTNSTSGWAHRGLARALVQRPQRDTSSQTLSTNTFPIQKITPLSGAWICVPLVFY